MARSWDDLSDDEKQNFRDRASANRDKNKQVAEQCKKYSEGKADGSFLKGLSSFIGGMAKHAAKIMDDYSKKR